LASDQERATWIAASEQVHGGGVFVKIFHARHR
jgi:hypothetical protein